jgi:hypothetical protein
MIIGIVLHKIHFAELILTILAIPLIMIIAIYLLACSIAPIVNLNNQTFKIIFTLAGGFTTLLFYFKKSD